MSDLPNVDAEIVRAALNLNATPYDKWREADKALDRLAAEVERLQGRLEAAEAENERLKDRLAAEDANSHSSPSEGA